MRRFMKNTEFFPDAGESPILYAFAFVFLCGCVIGSIAASAVGVSGSAAGILGGMLTNLSEGGTSGTFLSTFKYILIITFFSFTIFGAVAVPITVFAKGFFLSFTVSMFVCSYSYGGLAVAVSYFLVPEFFSICAILLIAAPAFSLSVNMLSCAFRISALSAPVTPLEKLPRFMFCYLLTLISFLWDKILTAQITFAVIERIGL